MFVYGVCVGPSENIATTLCPSLRALGLGPLIQRHRQRSIFEAYNSISEEAISRFPEIEGLVLLHDDVAIEDQRFEQKLRTLLADDRVGVIGAVGGRNHTAMSWWDTVERFGEVDEPTDREHWTKGTHEVDTIDGLLMVLSPWVVRNLPWRGEGYPGFHGYDSDMCANVRAAGRKVVVTDLFVRHQCKPSLTNTSGYQQAMYEYLLRWRAAAPKWRRLAWRSKHMVLSQRSRT